ncbi:hypothetical protein ASPCADRAFT_204226 [Aspergillus carbonarius ITEM 5010]|uniref:Uncharacterized protein n=1 Tax=Aspergillus carbonarius (strain ITEM 5010) TaxID=602072 RepID=A0A1R3RVN7_ASPC5|nr:hypothetical protein ASPCADRAFT_204226 [Aspergillus carbonarius ITEM 5010]
MFPFSSTLLSRLQILFGPVAAFPPHRRVIGKLYGVGFFRVTGITHSFAGKRSL